MSNKVFPERCESIIVYKGNKHGYKYNNNE
jgi:hypothetical protein